MLAPTGELHRLAMRLPRPRRRSEEMLEALFEGRTVIWTYPRTLNAEAVIRWIADACANGGLSVQEVTVKPKDDNPPASLHRILYGTEGADGDVPLTSDEIIAGLAARAPDVLILRDLAHLPEITASEWARFVSNWISYMKSLSADDDDPRALFIPTPDLDFPGLVEEEPTLLRRSYWGWIGDAEMRLLARELSHSRSISVPDRRWVETSFVGVVGSDVELLQWLVDGIHDGLSVAGIVQLLISYGQFRGWDEVLEQVRDTTDWANGHWPDWAESPTGAVMGPPAPGRLLWSRGLLHKDQYEGTCLHSAAVAMQGNRPLIEHRIWRGQTRTLFPVLDAVRLELCQFLSTRYPRWKSYVYTGSGPTGSNAAVLRGDTKIDEYPAIVAFLDGLQQRYRALRRLFEAAQTLRDCRNDLAHYNPLAKKQFDLLWRAVETCRNAVQQS